MLCKGTAAAVAARRMRNILGPLLGRDGWTQRTHEVKFVNTSSGNPHLVSDTGVTVFSLIGTDSDLFVIT